MLYNTPSNNIGMIVKLLPRTFLHANIYRLTAVKILFL